MWCCIVLCCVVVFDVVLCCVYCRTNACNNSLHTNMGNGLKQTYPQIPSGVTQTRSFMHYATHAYNSIFAHNYS